MGHPVYTILDNWLTGDELLFLFKGFEVEELQRLVDRKDIDAYQFVKRDDNGNACCLPRDKSMPTYSYIYRVSAVDTIKGKHPEAKLASVLYNPEKTIVNFANIYLSHLMHDGLNRLLNAATTLFRCMISVTGKHAPPDSVDNNVLVSIQSCLLSHRLSLRSVDIGRVLDDAWFKASKHLGVNVSFSVEDAIGMLPKQTIGRPVKLSIKTQLEDALQENKRLKSELAGKHEKTSPANVAKAQKTAEKWAIQLERAVSLAVECVKLHKPCSLADHENMWIKRFGEPPVRAALRAMRRALDDDMVEGPR